MTNFDLLGDFGRIEWLGNFKLVLFYNLIFATAAISCLVRKFTIIINLWRLFAKKFMPD